MRSASYDEVNPHRGGLPRWTLFAAVPLVLALGFITGVALSTYWPGTSAPSPPRSQHEARKPTGPDGSASPTPPGLSGSPTAPTQTAGGPGEAPDPRRPGTATTTLPQAADEIPSPRWAPRQTGPIPGREEAPTPAAIRSVVDARAALAAEFGSFRAGGTKAFSVDYQLARDINYNTVLIGIVKIADYGQWVKAVTEHPAELQAWLKEAAERVKPAAQSEKFTLTWTIYEKVTNPPDGFDPHEVTRDPRGGGYVVARPLAAVTDVVRSVVSIAAVDPASRPAASPAPWAAYGPVIRFDPTDLYRPTSAKP